MAVVAKAEIARGDGCPPLATVFSPPTTATSPSLLPVAGASLSWASPPDRQTSRHRLALREARLEVGAPILKVQRGGRTLKDADSLGPHPSVISITRRAKRLRRRITSPRRPPIAFPTVNHHPAGAPAAVEAIATAAERAAHPSRCKTSIRLWTGGNTGKPRRLPRSHPSLIELFLTIFRPRQQPPQAPTCASSFRRPTRTATPGNLALAPTRAVAFW